MNSRIDLYEKDGKTREAPKFPLPVEQVENAVFYHCKWHDYIYYPEAVENEDGVRYRAGYYDETGKYYGELKLYHSFPAEGLVCKYCNHRMTEEEFRETEELKCPKCDASYELLTASAAGKKDKVVTSEVNFTEKTDAQAKRYVHMTDNRVVPTGNVSRPRAAYDPNYDADSGTEFDKKNDLDAGVYERQSFVCDDAAEEKKSAEDNLALTVAILIITAIGLLVYGLGHMC